MDEDFWSCDMTETAWSAFCAAREQFRELCRALDAALPGLKEAQQRLVDARGAEPYLVETPVVYNTALDDLRRDDTARLILVADNPGQREQRAEARRYLVGPSGKIAESFFLRESSLGVDFRKNVIILNKTPIHTPRTVELKTLCAGGGDAIRRALQASQKKMAALLGDFACALSLPVWIIGYSEMKKRGVFETYTEELKALMASGKLDGEKIFFFRHFSMNQFTIDLGRQRGAGEPLQDALGRIGAAYRKRVLGR
jgi:uracil-DNA glycosylase